MVWLGHAEYFRNVLYNVVKFSHILLVITAVGSSITNGIWQGRAGSNSEHESFVRRGVKFLDDRVANPAYLLVLVTGLTMAVARTTRRNEVVSNQPPTGRWRFGRPSPA
jgi:hypothetical protein